jgi:hypothetical protein
MGLLDRFKKEPTEPEERFWAWFMKNKERVAVLLDGNGPGMKAYSELTNEFKRVHEDILPELTRDIDCTNVLVISADGRREAVEPVIALSDAAPEIPGWRVERFRKPAPTGMRIEYQGLDIDPVEIRIAYQVDEEKPLVHIAMLIPGYVEADKRFLGAGFLYLDHTIGEYNTIMHIGHLEFRALDRAPANAHLITLEELRSMIEKEFY